MPYQSGTRGSTVEKPAETQTCIGLASHLVRAPKAANVIKRSQTDLLNTVCSIRSININVSVVHKARDVMVLKRGQIHFEGH